MKQVLRRSPLAPAGLLGAILLILGTAGIGDGNGPDPRQRGGGGATVGAARKRRRDTGLPVTVEDAFVPSPGETEAQLHFSYDNQRPSGDEDKQYGRHLYTPEAEIEIGIFKGLSAMVAGNYSLGNAEDAKSGEAEAGAQVELPRTEGTPPGFDSERIGIRAIRI